MSSIDAQETPLTCKNQAGSELPSTFPPLVAAIPPPAIASAEPADAGLITRHHPLAPYGVLKRAGLRAAGTADAPWLWEGYLVRGGITLFTSLWKAGKTTLIAVLLARLRLGGPLAGRTLHPGLAVIVTEESPMQWRLRDDKLTFGDHITWLCRPFRGKPRLDDWLDVIDRLVTLRESEGLDLVVVDPLASFLPGRDENAAAMMMEALSPLQRLTSLGVSVLLAHHPRKRASPHGQIARGSGVLSAFVDILIEMERFEPNDDLDRRRRLRGYSRFDQTPRQAILELNADGTDYVHFGDFGEFAFGEGWDRVRRLLDDAPCKLRLNEILDDWPPEDPPPPGETSLRRWLDKAFAEGRVAREGTGHKNDPYLYWLPGKELTWDNSPLWWLNEKEEPFDILKVEQEANRQEKRKRWRGRG